MRRAQTRDIPRLIRLVDLIEGWPGAVSALYEKLVAEEEAICGYHASGNGVFRLSLAGLKVQTTAGNLNALLMWQGRAREAIAAAGVQA